MAPVRGLMSRSPEPAHPRHLHNRPRPRCATGPSPPGTKANVCAGTAQTGISRTCILKRETSRFPTFFHPPSRFPIRACYEFLIARGLRVFLSCESLKQLGKSDYRAAIDQALDE